MSASARTAFAAICLAAASCVRPFIDPGPNGSAVIKSARLGLYTKKVVTKRAPETLVAEDGTICRVAPDRFNATETGTAVYCNWQ